MLNTFLSLLLFIFGHLTASSQENLLWKFETGDRIYSTPVVDGNNIFIGSGDHHLYSVNKDTGKFNWKYETKGPVHSSPSVFENLVLFGSGDGNLYALNKDRGTLVWKFSSKGERTYGLWDYYLSSPLIREGTVFWGSGDGNMYALDAGTGKLKWKFESSGIIHASPVIEDDVVYIGSFDGYFYALNKDSGKLVWKFNTIGAKYFPKGEIQKAALAEDGTVYFGSRDYNIYALDAKTGKGKWNYRDPNGWIIATPMIYRDRIYFGTSDAHAFYCMDRNSGRIFWKKHLNMRVYGSATEHNGLIYFGTFDGKVLGLSPLSGETKWQFQTEASKQNYSSIYNKNGKFREGFELYGEHTEENEAMIQSLGSVLSTPVIENDIIYFGSSDGSLYAINLNNNSFIE